MDALTIVLLTLAIAVLAGALAWFGPRRRHWQTHSAEKPISDTGAPGDSASDNGASA